MDDAPAQLTVHETTEGYQVRDQTGQVLARITAAEEVRNGLASFVKRATYRTDQGADAAWPTP
jgi:hypothetical protein